MSTLFYRAQSGAFGYTPRFDRLFETEGERADCIAGLALSKVERAMLEVTGYTDLSADRLDGLEFIRYSMVDVDSADYQHELAMDEVRELVAALAILDGMIAARGA